MRRRHRSRRAVAVGLALSLIVLVPACGSGGSSSSSSTTTYTQDWVDRSGTWTVFAYVDADNNIEGDAIVDIQEMAAATTTRFIVMVDRAPGYSHADLFGLGDFTDTVILSIEGGSVSVLQRPGELDMGSPDTLSSFIQYGLSNFRGQKNALVLWDHGGSWKGIAWDDSSSDPSNPQLTDHLTMAEVSSAIGKGLGRAGVDRFDLIGFDACLMATYEVAMSIAPYGDVMLASEELEPGSGWNWVAAGTGPAGATTSAFVDSMLNGYRAQTGSANVTDATLSAVDLHAVDVVTAAVEELTQAISAPTVRIGSIGSGRSRAVGFGESPNPTYDAWSVDLGSFATKIDAVDGVESAAQRLHDAVHAAVIRHVSGAVSREATGLSAYFPPTAKQLTPGYSRAGLAPAWSEFLRVYFAQTEAVPTAMLPRFTNPDRVLEPRNVLADSSSIEIVAKVTPGTGGNIVSSSFLFGVVDAVADDVVVLGRMDGNVAGDTVSGAFTWRCLTITDGTSTVPAYAELSFDPRGRLQRITVPLVLTDGIETAPGRLVVATQGETILSTNFYILSDDAISGLPASSGIRFLPVVERIRPSTGADSWVPSSTVSFPTEPDAIGLSFARLDPGTTVFTALSIVDVKGGVDMVTNTTPAPPE